MNLAWSSAALASRFVGGLLAFMDSGAGACRIQLYAASEPGGTPLAVLVLAKPSGILVSGQLVLVQADAEGDLIMGSGTPLSARMINGNGDRVCDGDVSDVSGDGAFKVEGESGALLYAGGRARLVDSYFS